jgi:hypothetical protein
MNYSWITLCLAIEEGSLIVRRLALGGVSGAGYSPYMTKKCPGCNSKEGVREYLYGLPMDQPDAGKYVLGGCCISEDMPDYKCINCFTDFYKDSDEFHNRFIADSSAGISFQCKECEEWFPLGEGIEAHVCGIL